MAPLRSTETFELAVHAVQRSSSEALTLNLSTATSGADLIDLMSSRYGEPFGIVLGRTGQRVMAQDRVIDIGIVWGDELQLIDPDCTTHPVSGRYGNGEGGLVLHVIDGPSHGLRLPIAEAVTVGRKNNPGVHGLLGETTSRMHAEIAPSLAGGRIHDLGSKNGTWVNGTRITHSAPLTAGDRIVVGENLAVVELDVFPSRTFDLPHLTKHDTRVAFNRPPRVLEPEPNLHIAVGDAPEKPPRRRFPVGAAIAPLILGIAMAILWNPLFALFIALSPLMLAFSFFDERRSGRNDYAKDAADFKQRVEGAANEAKHRTEQVASYLRSQAPDDRQLAWWAHAAAAEVWSRRPTNNDFFIVGLGTRSTSELLTIEVPAKGDEALLDEAAETLGAACREVRVPFSINLEDHAIVAFCGDVPTSRAMVRSVISQLATLRSPRDLQLMFLAPGSKTRWSWANWLPHVSTISGESNVALTNHDVGVAFTAIEELISERERLMEASVGVRQVFHSVVVVIEGTLPISPLSLSRVLEAGPAVGIRVMFIGHHRFDLPGEATVVIESHVEHDRRATSSAMFTETGKSFLGLDPRKVSPTQAARLARSLAPLLDLTAGGVAADLPVVVTLDDLVPEPETNLPVERFAERIEQRWSSHGGNLAATIGSDSKGGCSIDLRRDGPHALVVGTTGSGKSEFLQTLVASMALSYPPERLNFILIDYKGGAAFARCSDLPHTVGLVTNLDERLAERALLSLRAELRRRETVLALHDANDLETLEMQNPAAAPPSLVLVIDEFAALRTEVPAFVDGIVDIAQRGRSMGVHLVLATQKPGGVITPQIEANTNIRVALRVANESESRDVLSTPDAAAIDRTIPGRAILRIGTDDGLHVQTAWVGRRDVPVTEEATSVRSFGSSPISSALASDPNAPTDLDKAVLAVALAAENRQTPEQYRPWIEELSTVITTTEVTPNRPPAHDPRVLAIGVADRPDLQRQDTWSLDLGFESNAAIFGASGSGKTTLLRTLATQVASYWNPQQAVIYALDAAGGGLRCLGDLPHVGAVADGNDLSELLLFMDVLRREYTRRSEAMAGRGVDSYEMWQRLEPSEAPPVMLLLIDGLDSIWSAIEALDAGRVGAELVELLASAGSVGIHAVWTARRRGSIPSALLASAGARLVQRLSSPDEYGWFGLNLGDQVVPPGRTFLPNGLELQIIVHSASNGDCAAGDQIEAIAKLAASVNESWSGEVPMSLPRWPSEVLPKSLPATQSLSSVAVGVDAFGDAVSVDFSRNATLLVVGPAQSGRSTVLAGLVDGLGAAVDRRVLVSPRRGSPLRSVSWDAVISQDMEQGLSNLIGEANERRQRDDKIMAVVIDDADDLLDGIEADQLASLVRSAADANIIVLAAASTFLVGSSYAQWMRMMRNMGPGIVLQPTSREDTEIFNAPYPRRGLGDQPAGRGLLVDRQQATAAQFLRGTVEY